MENKKSEMSVEYNMDEMKKSLKNLKETECYDVEKYTYSLLHQTRQLEYFYCQLVEALGIEIDDDANVNGKGDRLISTPNSKVKVYVIPTNEELVIARDTKRLLNL